MNELDEFRKRSRAARENLDKAEKQQAQLRHLLQHRQNELAGALRGGKAGKDEQRRLQKEMDSLNSQI
jgi:ribosome recycling factor